MGEQGKRAPDVLGEANHVEGPRRLRRLAQQHRLGRGRVDASQISRETSLATQRVAARTRAAGEQRERAEGCGVAGGQQGL